jgi:hypothetical protein
MVESPTASKWSQNRVLPFALLFLGFFFWRIAGVPLPSGAVVAVLVALIVAAVPATRQAVWNALERIRQPSPPRLSEIALHRPDYDKLPHPHRLAPGPRLCSQIP